MTGHSLAGQGSQVSFTSDHLESGMSPRRKGASSGLPRFSQPFVGALLRAERIGQPGLSKNSNITSTHGSLPFPTLEPSLHRKAGTEQTADSIWSVPQTTCLIRHQEMLLCWSRSSFCPYNWKFTLRYKNGMESLPWMTRIQVDFTWSWLEWLQKPDYLARCPRWMSFIKEDASITASHSKFSWSSGVFSQQF